MTSVLHVQKYISILYDIGRELAGSGDMSELLNRILNILSEKIDMTRGMIHLYHVQTDEILIDVSYGYTDEEIERGNYKPGEGIVGSVIKTGEPECILSIADEPRFLNRTGAKRGNKNISFISVPIKMTGATIGSISIDVEDKKDELSDVLNLVTSLAVMISFAVKSRLDMHDHERKLIEENRLLRRRLSTHEGFHRLVGKSKSMQELYEKISLVADTDSTVLISGESGTGKELIADSIHHNSSRRDKPFIKVNIAALPENLIESELFGYEKGAFTGASREKPGRFEMANGGTIFLDEIGDLSIHLQILLLRVIQEKCIERLGGTRTISLDVRIITATHRNLEEKISNGEFREDLYYRLNVFPLYAPSLKERNADILLLADFFLEKYNSKMNKKITRISSEAIDLLTRYHWPGNVRELENCMERAVIMSKENVIRSYNFSPSLQFIKVEDEVEESLDNLTNLYIKELIIDQLKLTRGNISEAARNLKTTKRILNYKIKSLGVNYKLYRRSVE